MKKQTIKPKISKQIALLRSLIRDGIKKITLREQCTLDPDQAVAWQAALVLEGKRSVITRNQNKLSKSKGINWINRGLTLSPANEADPYFVRTFNNCPFATDACILACVGAKTGQSKLPSSKIARIGRTLALNHDPRLFAELIKIEIDQENLERKKLEWITGEEWWIAFRVNVASDNIGLADTLSNAYAYNDPVKFYDYTVIPKAMTQNLGYVERVYSRKDSTNEGTCLDLLDRGYGIAAVFAGDLPDTWKGYPVIDGDVNDLWFTRKPSEGGFVVGLKVKGSNAQKQACIDSGFAIETPIARVAIHKTGSPENDQRLFAEREQFVADLDSMDDIEADQFA